MKKTCPGCAARIKSQAQLCRHCGYNFQPPPPTFDYSPDTSDTPLEISAGERVAGTGCGLLLIFAAVFGVHQCSQRNEPTVEEIQEQAEAAMAERAKGFHCLTAWDGSNPSLVQQVEASLREPGSFEHIDTTITPLVPETGKHGVSMTFRARNGFGGMNVGRAVGEVDPRSCDAENVVIDAG